MEDERCKFIYRFLNRLDIAKFFDSFVKINSVKQLNYQIRLIAIIVLIPF